MPLRLCTSARALLPERDELLADLFQRGAAIVGNQAATQLAEVDHEVGNGRAGGTGLKKRADTFEGHRPIVVPVQRRDRLLVRGEATPAHGDGPPRRSRRFERRQSLRQAHGPRRADMLGHVLSDLEEQRCGLHAGPRMQQRAGPPPRRGHAEGDEPARRDRQPFRTRRAVEEQHGLVAVIDRDSAHVHEQLRPLVEHRVALAAGVRAPRRSGGQGPFKARPRFAYVKTEGLQRVAASSARAAPRGRATRSASRHPARRRAHLRRSAGAGADRTARERGWCS